MKIKRIEVYHFVSPPTADAKGGARSVHLGTTYLPAHAPTSAHLAASTHTQSLLTVSFMNDWTKEHIAGSQPRSSEGFGSAPTGPGLGIEVNRATLGKPLFTVG